MDNQMRWLLIIVAVAVVVLMPLLFARKAPPPPQPVAPAVTAPVVVPLETAPVEPARPLISEAILGRLLFGMTYDQVVKVVGSEADETESQYDRGEPGLTSPSLTQWRIWKNPDGASLRVGFLSNKLDQKQFRPKGDTAMKKENAP